MIAKVLKKIDDVLFKNISKVVNGWVRRKKFKQHKMDFALMMKNWEASWWVAITLWQAYQYFTKHHLGAVAAQMVLLLFIALLEGTAYAMMKNQKRNHDVLFANRKNPNVYQMEKIVLELVREQTYKTRVFAVVMMLVLAVFVATVNPLLLPIYIGGGLQIYISLVFDFDEPEQKEKAKESITEILKKSWENLTKEFKPQGV